MQMMREDPQSRGMNPELIKYTHRAGHAISRADQLPPGLWHRIRRGAYYPSDEWARLRPEDRHRALILATSELSGGELPCLSHLSAACWWGLPVLGAVPRVVHVAVRGRSRSSQGLLKVHALGAQAVQVEHRGAVVTDPITTVLDIARSSPFRNGLVVADAAVRSKRVTAEQLRQAVDAIPRGARGRTIARHVALLADGRSDSVLESLSRAVMFTHRLAKPDLQVVVRDGGVFLGRADFGWEGLVGECDGAMKYGADLSDGDPSAAVYREKRREDRMRQVTGFVRWGWREAFHERPLVQLLRANGVPRVPLSRWFDAPIAETTGRN